MMQPEKQNNEHGVSCQVGRPSFSDGFRLAWGFDGVNPQALATLEIWQTTKTHSGRIQNKYAMVGLDNETLAALAETIDIIQERRKQIGG